MTAKDLRGLERLAFAALCLEVFALAALIALTVAGRVGTVWTYESFLWVMGIALCTFSWRWFHHRRMQAERRESL